VGLVAIVVVVLSSIMPPEPTRRALRWLSSIVLVAIVLQGVMGGVRVTEVSLTLARIHAVFGQIVFAMVIMLAAIACVPRWMLGSLESKTETESGSNRRLHLHGSRLHRNDSAVPTVCLGITLLIVAQLLLGVLMRHDPTRDASGGGAGLAITDWPLHYGQLLPPTSEQGLQAVNTHRTWRLELPAVSMYQVWLHFAHRCGAYLTCVALIGLLVVAVRRRRALPWLLAPAIACSLLVTVQATLGVLTVLLGKPADIATAHQATGALLLGAVVLMTARSWAFARTRRIARTIGTMQTQSSEGSESSIRVETSAADSPRVGLHPSLAR
jgi:cytochrome c oxidase assembly protein subunit 15